MNRGFLIKAMNRVSLVNRMNRGFLIKAMSRGSLVNRMNHGSTLSGSAHFELLYG
jgi:hypothetical protein